MPRKDQGGVVSLLGKVSATPSGSVEPADPKGLSSLGATDSPQMQSVLEGCTCLW